VIEGNGFEMNFITAKMAANFVYAGGPGRPNYLLKLAHSHSGRSRVEVDIGIWFYEIYAA
jgi:hypothetical protein